MGGAGEPTGVDIGQLVGKYRVESLIGQGGMAAVYRGVHLELGQRVAIKTLLLSCAEDDRLVERFFREARTIAKIQSRHVARVFDIGRLESTEAPYIVLELLDGQDLGKELEARGVLPIPTAVDYVIQATEGLARAHALGIVHRDVKPSNLFLTRESDGRETVKVIDFGIAKQVATDGYKLTTTSEVFGSPQYMAPEQIRASQGVDARADLWALGIVLYELLTGASAFAGTSVLELAGSILHSSPTPIESHRRGIPFGLERTILRCLEKAPEKRFSSARELVVALAPFASPNGAAVAAAIDRSSDRLPIIGDDAMLEPTQLADSPPDSNASLDGTGTDLFTSHDASMAAPSTLAPPPRFVWVALVPVALAMAGVGALYATRTAVDAPVDEAPSASAPPPSPVDHPATPAPSASIAPASSDRPAPASDEPKPHSAPTTTPNRPRPPPPTPSVNHGRTSPSILPRKGGD